ncbi:MAG: hypothetical protein AAF646_12970 [Pseudomonadota bacterium]
MTAQSVDTFEDAAAQARASGTPFLSELGPYILAAVTLGAARDTRSLARVLGVAHALVIRECNSLGEELGLLEIEDRGDRSQRVFVSLSDTGAALFGGGAR